MRKKNLPRKTETATQHLSAFASTNTDLNPLRSVLCSVPEPLVCGEALVPAAVLFPIVLRADNPSVLFTLRTEQLRDHPGQISFPGGRVEPEDASPAQTALREAWEEIGLHPAHAEVLGYLPDYRTGTGFRITPVVALLNPPFDLCPDASEVAEVFEVPLAFLLDPANHQSHAMTDRGHLRHYVAMTYGKHHIWGATAAIIVHLAQALSA